MTSSWVILEFFDFLAPGFQECFWPKFHFKIRQIRERRRFFRTIIIKLNEIFLPIWYHALVWISYQLFMAFSWPILPVSINIILCSIFYHKTVHGLWWLLKRDLSCFHLKRCRFSIHLNPLVRRAANRSLLVTNSIWSGLLL